MQAFRATLEARFHWPIVFPRYRQTFELTPEPVGNRRSETPSGAERWYNRAKVEDRRFSCAALSFLY